MKDSLLQVSEGVQSCQHLNFRLLDPRTVRVYISVVEVTQCVVLAKVATENKYTIHHLSISVPMIQTTFIYHIYLVRYQALCIVVLRQKR